MELALYQNVFWSFWSTPWNDCWLSNIYLKCYKIYFYRNLKSIYYSNILTKDNPLLLKSVPSRRGRASAGTRRSGEEEGKSKGRRPPWKLCFERPQKLQLSEWKVVPSLSIYIPAIIIEEQGAIGTLTEWQNLYSRREIMVLGMGLKEAANFISSINGRILWRIREN